MWKFRVDRYNGVAVPFHLKIYCAPSQNCLTASPPAKNLWWKSILGTASTRLIPWNYRPPNINIAFFGLQWRARGMQLIFQISSQIKLINLVLVFKKWIVASLVVALVDFVELWKIEKMFNYKEFHTYSLFYNCWLWWFCMNLSIVSLLVWFKTSTFGT